MRCRGRNWGRRIWLWTRRLWHPSWVTTTLRHLDKLACYVERMKNILESTLNDLTADWNTGSTSIQRRLPAPKIKQTNLTLKNGPCSLNLPVTSEGLPQLAHYQRQVRGTMETTRVSSSRQWQRHHQLDPQHENQTGEASTKTGFENFR